MLPPFDRWQLGGFWTRVFSWVLISPLYCIAESAVEWPWLAGQKSHTWYSGSLWPNSEFYPWPPANWAMGHCHVTCLWTHDMRHWRKRKYLLVNRYYWKQFMPNEYKTMNFITGKQNWYLSERKKKCYIYMSRGQKVPMLLASQFRRQ